MNLTYVTGNYGKYVRVKERFEKSNLDINFYKYDLDEPLINDIEFISKEKAKSAYDLLNSPVFVADSGFYIEDYPNNPGYPGAFVKRSGVSSDIDHLLEVMNGVENRNCYFLECLTYYDGSEFKQFFGKSAGTLSLEKKGPELKKSMSNLWEVFIPNNYTKTLAEMTDFERENRNDNRTSAIDEFIQWYKKEYIYNNHFVKKRKNEF